MLNKRTWMALGLCAVVWAFVSPATAVVMEWMLVDDPGNTGELSGAGAGGTGPDRICGAVGYVYCIGKYEATNTQYCEFLNAVAAADTHGLYNTEMAWGFDGIGGITRSGLPGSYTYAVRPDRGNRPVNYVSWYDALRFANWLDNDQPSGAQDVTSTEDGAYDMSLGVNTARKPGARVWLADEDEWYKAAYYRGGGTNSGYWDYPTQSDTAPASEAPPGTDLVNGSANYGSIVGPPYYTTEVGAYSAKPSASAYGTFDQGGNLWEWNDTMVSPGHPGFRAGSFGSEADFLRAYNRFDAHTPDHEALNFGFRVAAIPEPAMSALLCLGALALVRGRRK